MNDCGGSHSASTKASSNAPRSRIRFASRSKPSAARSKRGDERPARRRRDRLAVDRRDPDLERVHQPLGHLGRARLLALEPDEHQAWAQRARQRLGRERRRGGQQLAHAIEVVRDHPVGQVAPRDRLARARDQQARGRVEVDAVGRLELRSRRRTRSAASRRRARTRARTPPASRSRRRPPPRRATARPCAAARPRARAAAAAAARPATRPSPPPAAGPGGRARSARGAPASPRRPARRARR